MTTFNFRKLAAKDKPVNFKNVLPELMEAKFLSVDDPLAESIRKVHCVKWNPNNLIRPSRVSWSTLQTVAPRICDCIEIYNTNIDIDIAEAEIDEIVDLFPDPMDVDDLVPDPMDVDVADDDNSNLFSNYMDEPPIANDFFPSPFEVDVAPNVAILPVCIPSNETCNYSKFWFISGATNAVSTYAGMSLDLIKDYHIR